MSTINFAIVGCGGITLQNHLPGIAMCPDTAVVALCDTDPATLERARQQTGARVTSSRFEEVVTRDEVDAVIIATPNFTHASIARAAFDAGKHVLCEKPIAMNRAEAIEMVRAAEAKRVRHMTAFTYRFVPAMRYLAHLVKKGFVGAPYHFRSCRLQDWGDRNLGWRQVKKLAGTGELGDMLSHRIDFAHLLIGRMKRLVANTKIYLPERGGAPSDLDDWVAIIAEFVNGATGVLESSKLATGRGESWRSQDYCEVNGSEGSVVFYTGKWNELLIGRRGGQQLEAVPVPREFWTWPGSPRDPQQGDPLVTFRHDQTWEFVDAIRNGRPCSPSLHDGLLVQSVMDAAVSSAEQGAWLSLPEFD